MNPTEAAIGLLHMSKKVLEGGGLPSKGYVHQRDAEIRTTRRIGAKYFWKKWLMVMANIWFLIIYHII